MGKGAVGLVVVPLESGRAGEAAVTGAKAAALARARAAGLPVLPGFALVPPGDGEGAADEEELRRAWAGLRGQGDEALVVRSSSTGEDSADSSRAGRFVSVLNVRGWDEFGTAVRRVRESADAGEPGERMAVLVQPMRRAVAGGVVFGADPVAGRPDRILVSAVRGGPDRLVGGAAQGVRYQLTRLGRLVGTEPPEGRRHRVLGRRRLARLVQLARRTERALGGPQDMEFGFDEADRLWLFQARPITAMGARPSSRARLLGPGPVADTFPEVLQPLEEDMWLEPMAHGLTLALDIGGTAPRRLLRTLPTVTTVNGRAAADLRLLGAVPSPHPVLHVLNPAPGARRASAAWRMGRLRSALPLLAADLMAEVDRELAGLPPPGGMLGGQLLAALAWGRTVLTALHAQESLAGALLGPGTGLTAAGEALAVLAECRAAGRSPGEDAALIARHPVLLALLPPSLRGPGPLPARTGGTGAPRGVAALPVREGLRMRVRWVQEMQARVVREVAARGRGTAEESAVGVGPDAPDLERLALLRWPELADALAAGPPEPSSPGRFPADLAGRRPRPEAPELPAAFRLAAGGRIVPERPGRRAGGGEGQGAGGGFGTGTAWHGTGERPERAVLVVRTLDPALAPHLPGLAGLVAETGSVLAHLAVLAREYGVPTVVGVPGALERFPPGARVRVDGAAGAVSAETPAGAP
ncbi:PEP/pyruvate-binding domain-containing protein [Streptomyces sp. DSM 44917]|uniref:PEP/pyruvate-binding domain-containing protein n=1 Tax=Streptomyces boetiae TaxID=3075541 RepID=A0ABU2LC04_9ACTN|nr:PEP/pyruvate-binding domain-containing protein [Streptomyces sp. DSM 44917]MDT0309042.1 PEP/pyruvate-binding domain-containing protein [Streptomyces sp. DSM 44917]